MTYDEALAHLYNYVKYVTKKPPDEEIATVWAEMTDFEKRWYFGFLQATRYHNSEMARALAVMAGIDPVEFLKKVKREHYLQYQELINITSTKYWEYVTDHSTRWKERKARRKRKPSPKNPDTCQRELDWDAGYWFSGGTVDVYEMQGRRHPEEGEADDYTQQPAWWPK